MRLYALSCRPTGVKGDLVKIIYLNSSTVGYLLMDHLQSTSSVQMSTPCPAVPGTVYRLVKSQFTEKMTGSRIDALSIGIFNSSQMILV